MANPDFIVSTPMEIGIGDKKKTIWTNVGIAFKSKDGGGLNITLNALPVSGRLFVKKFVPKQQPASKKDVW